MTSSRVARGSQSYRSGGYTMASASGPERGKGREGGGCLSLKVRGESSQCLHQGDAEREEYLKVRTPIDFFFLPFLQKKNGKKARV